MIEIVFTEGAAYSIQMAKSLKNIVGSSTSVIFRKPDGSIPTPDELSREQARVEDEIRNKLKNAVPMEETTKDVAYFPLNLSIGDISEPFSDERAEFLQSMVLINAPDFSWIGAEMMDSARESLEQVRANTEPVRIWTSSQPDEFCGFCHILTQLPENADIRVVELPSYEVRGNEIRTYSAWNEIDHYEIGRFQSLERPLTDTQRRYFAGLWRELQSENGPMRAVVNGRLCTVEADFYDWLILRELEMQPSEFNEARLIGKILGKYPLGLSDSLIGLRIEELISRGILTPTTDPELYSPIYHRFLRKEHI